MLSFAPELVEDELLISYVARWYHLSGFSSVDRFFRAAFGGPVKADSVNASLNLKLQWTGGVVANSEQIIRNMTFAPYARVFVGLRGLAQIFSVPPTGRRVPRRPTVFGQLPWRVNDLRYCELCCQAQEREMGVRVWTRRHNLPGVSACSKHNVQLQSVPFRRDRLELVPMGKKGVGFRRAYTEDIWFAKQSEELLKRGFELSYPSRWRAAVRADLIGFFKTAERKKRDVFVFNALRDQFSEDFLKQLNLMNASNWSRSLDMLCSSEAKISNPVFTILLAKILHPSGLPKLVDVSSHVGASATKSGWDRKSCNILSRDDASMSLIHRVSAVKQRFSKQLPLFS